MPALNVLTLNAHMGFSLSRRRFVLPALREAIRSVSADLVFLQEVLGAHAHHARRHADWPAEPQYEFLADTTWGQHAYGRNAAYPHGHHGNALLSKFAILRDRNHDVSVQGHEGRGLLHCVIDVPAGGGELHAVCAHLGLRESHRRRQLGLLCGLLRDGIPADEPVVVAGDFNDWRGRGHPLLHACGLREAFVETNGRLARSFPSVAPVLPLDRIYVRGASARDPRVLGGRPWSRLSDHAPLLARVEW